MPIPVVLTGTVRQGKCAYLKGSFERDGRLDNSSWDWIIPRWDSNLSNKIRPFGRFYLLGVDSPALPKDIGTMWRPVQETTTLMGTS